MSDSNAGSARQPEGSARQLELLEAAYGYALEHGLADLSLRPLAAAIGSSPRVLLYLFGSKDGLILALLGRARRDELESLRRVRAAFGTGTGLAAAVSAVWAWVSKPSHRPLATLWLETYARSLVEPDGTGADFARTTVQDLLAVLAQAQPPSTRESRDAVAARTLALAVLRGALLDLLATGDLERTGAAVQSYLATLR